MKYLVYIFAATLAFSLGWCARSSDIQGNAIISDTVKSITTRTEYKRDTLLVPYPIPYITQFTGDSIKVGEHLVPKEQKMYRDSDYTAWISGVSPTLDSIAVYPKTVYLTNDIYHTITKYKASKKWGLGIIAGYGIGKNGLSPYVGIGISYRFY